jgi:hypothetical protein
VDPRASGCGINALAAVERLQPAIQFLIEVRKLGGSGVVVLFQKPERLADDLTGGIIPAGLNLGADELFQFGGQGKRSWEGSQSHRTLDGEDCQCL